MNHPKITEHHHSRLAYVYLRQSTPGQVLHHQESTERQYALREKVHYAANVGIPNGLCFPSGLGM